MIINFENAASRRHLVQKSESLWMARSEMTRHSFNMVDISRRVYIFIEGLNYLYYFVLGCRLSAGLCF